MAHLPPDIEKYYITQLQYHKVLYCIWLTELINQFQNSSYILPKMKIIIITSNNRNAGEIQEFLSIYSKCLALKKITQELEMLKLLCICKIGDSSKLITIGSYSNWCLKVTGNNSIAASMVYQQIKFVNIYFAIVVITLRIEMSFLTLHKIKSHLRFTMCQNNK